MWWLLLACVGYEPDPGATWPCDAVDTPWPTSQALLIQSTTLGGVDTFEFLQAVRLDDTEHNPVLLIVAPIDADVVALCSIEGLKPDTTYQWTLELDYGAYASHEVGAWIDTSDVVRFRTDGTQGHPAPTSDACEELADLSVMNDTRCLPQDTG